MSYSALQNKYHFPLIRLLADDFAARQWPCSIADEPHHQRLRFRTGNGHEDYTFSCRWDVSTSTLKVSCSDRYDALLETPLARSFHVRADQWRKDVSAAFSEMLDLCDDKGGHRRQLN